MNSTLSNVIAFAAGAAIGSLVTWKLIKTKYEQMAREDIDSIRELYSKMDTKKEEHNETNCEREEYEDLLKDSGYSSDEEEENMAEPYVISPDEYDENGYETVTLYLYADGVLAEAYSNEVIENVDELIGEDSLNHFGEYEDDSVFVRNDNLQTDFEILKDQRRFSEAD